VREKLHVAGLRVEVDDRSEKVGRKIRDWELKKVPYMLVVGDKEAEAGQVAVRRHGEGDTGSEAVDALAARLAEAAAHRDG
jgi:threonyl-tRNA synthetase